MTHSTLRKAVFHFTSVSQPLVLAAVLLSGHAFAKPEPSSQAALTPSIPLSKKLTDYSYAGYHRGEKEIPTNKVTASVVDFGAIPNDGKDDSDAFLRAIQSTQSGVIHVPAGKYHISKTIKINKPNLVIRGDGMDKTTLFFTKTLTDILPKPTKNTGGTPTSKYSWSGGFIQIKGAGPTSKKLGKISHPATRGDRTITLNTSSSTSHLKPGQMVLIHQRDDSSRSLIQHLYNNDTGDLSKMKITGHTSFLAKILSIEKQQITLDRAIITDIDPRWNPSVETPHYSVTECGLENFTIEFPNTPYKGHFTEKGYNGIEVNSAKDCWIRNVRIKNADSGIFLKGLCHTVDHLVLESSRKMTHQGFTGHHGFTFDGNDCLLTNINITTSFIHDISVGPLCSGNVASKGKGANLSFDHHKRAPHNNLFTNIHAGKGTRIFASGGGRKLGRNCAGWTTFWGISSNHPLSVPHDSFAPKTLKLVGFSIPKGKTSKYQVTSTPPENLTPKNLYEFQKQQRLLSH